ncbi:hypothetical protein ENBRE01_2231 [Enteropsectra breve]|nr:hypothetical protein ENBRE01_1219 [Enteropsectra breve]KAI5151577.1 hypothetical protein ENBRE01_2231 [Enteropsectra breve]
MEEGSKVIQKYKDNIKRIIEKYEKIDDTHDDIVDIMNYEEPTDSFLAEVSFIKKGIERDSASLGCASFMEIYESLFNIMDFEDIARCMGVK